MTVSPLIQRARRSQAMARSILARAQGAATGALPGGIPRRLYRVGVMPGLPIAELPGDTPAPLAPKSPAVSALPLTTVGAVADSAAWSAPPEPSDAALAGALAAPTADGAALREPTAARRIPDDQAAHLEPGLSNLATGVSAEAGAVPSPSAASALPVPKQRVKAQPAASEEPAPQRSPAAWAAQLFPNLQAAEAGAPGASAEASAAALAPTLTPGVQAEATTDRSPIAWAARLYPEAHAVRAATPGTQHAAPLVPNAAFDPAARSPTVWAARLFGQEAGAARAASPPFATPAAGGSPAFPGSTPGSLGALAATPTSLSRGRAAPGAPATAGPPRRFVPALPVSGVAPAQTLERSSQASVATGAPVALPPNSWGTAASVMASTAPTPTAPTMPSVSDGPVSSEAPSMLSNPASPLPMAPTDLAGHSNPPGGQGLVAPEQAPWNGLPAPWEPLPAVELAPPRFVPPTEQPPAANTEAARFSGSAGAAAPRGAGSAAQRHPAPDLDALTDQVYARLRRRLGAERRLFDLD